MSKITRYFNEPTQVKFYDEDSPYSDHYLAGIAYRDEIICGCCGNIIDIDELYEFAPDGIEPIIPFEDWIDITEAIRET